MARKPEQEILDPEPQDEIPELPARRPGRPLALVLDDRLMRQVQALGEMQCTINEAAGALGVSHVTLLAFFSRHPEARDAFQTGREYGKASVRRAQYKMALEVPQMSIWWGKQNLGQSDKVESTTTHVSMDPEERVKRVVELQKRVAERKAPTAPAIPQIGKAGKGGDQ
jgi:hypothetical protein